MPWGAGSHSLFHYQSVWHKVSALYLFVEQVYKWLLSVPRTMPGSWYVFNKGSWNELIFSDHFSGEVRTVVELLREDSWKSLGAPGSQESLCLGPSFLHWSRLQPQPVPRFHQACCFSHFSWRDKWNWTFWSERCCLIDSKAGNSDPSTETFPGDQITGSSQHSSICSLATCPLTPGLTTWTLTRSPPGQGMARVIYYHLDFPGL